MKASAIENMTGKGELKYKEVTRLRFFALPWPFTRFMIHENDLVRKSGLLSVREDDCLMYKIMDVQIQRGLLQRVMGLSTIRCLTSDVTDKEIRLKNIRHGLQIKNYLVEQSERARLMRRTVNMQSIGFVNDDTVDLDDLI